MDHIDDTSSLLFWREVGPAGQRRQGDRVVRCEFEALVLLPAATRRILLCTVEPIAFKRLVLDEGTDCMDAR
jgi:hypothetical protein